MVGVRSLGVPGGGEFAAIVEDDAFAVSVWCCRKELALAAPQTGVVAVSVVVLLLDLLVGHLGVYFFAPSSVQWFVFTSLVLPFLSCTGINMYDINP